jgi:hypothetical protein
VLAHAYEYVPSQASRLSLVRSGIVEADRKRAPGSFEIIEFRKVKPMPRLLFIDQCRDDEFNAAFVFVIREVFLVISQIEPSVRVRIFPLVEADPCSA